jgi:small subunit ribosomal protein S17
MAETQNTQTEGRRNTKVGYVTSTKMQKTIVVQVTRQKSHALYRRVISRSKKFYAHDENNQAHVGDVVLIEETRPMSRLKRWRLKEVIRKAALVPATEESGAEKAS